MSKQNVATVTNVVEALAKQLGAPKGVDTTALALQLTKDLGVMKPEVRRRLTVGEVKAIRHLAAYGVAQAYMAAEFEVSAATISQVVNRKTWAHV